MSHYDRMIEIMRERERLIMQCNDQRMAVAALVQQFDGTIGVIDQVVGAVNYFRRHPMMLGVAVAMLALVQRRGLWGWVRRGFLWWRAYRAFRSPKFTVNASS